MASMQFTPFEPGMEEPDRAEVVANMAAAARNVFGPDVVFHRSPSGTGIYFPMGIPSATSRPGNYLFESLIKNPKGGDDFLKKNTKNLPPLERSVRANLLRSRADEFMSREKYLEAARLYILGAESLCQAGLPVRRARSTIYMDLSLLWEVPDAMECLTGAAKAFMNAKNFPQALMWIGEAQQVEKSVRYVQYKERHSQSFDWYSLIIKSVAHNLQLFRIYITLSDLYYRIGNTGASVCYRFQAQAILESTPTEDRSPNFESLNVQCSERMLETAAYRHPEPSLVAKQQVQDDQVHLRGSWRRIELKHPGGLAARIGSGVFVYEGCLYVVGGQKSTRGPFYRDFWRLSLSKMDKWKELPPCPITEREQHSLYGFSPVVASDRKAYYFTGSRTLAFFDLDSLTWGFMRTTIQSDSFTPLSWPYVDNRLTFATVQAVGDRLYVFGGYHALSHLGCDLLLELNLTTKIWRRLSGTILPQDTEPTMIGPRSNACSWVSKDNSKIYVLYGDADRMGAQMNNEPQGAECLAAYGYDDLWSWDIAEGKWTREKLVGNLPSPRTEMAAVYNPVLDKVITFGGYSPTSPTYFPQKNVTFTYSYYADTFICDFGQPKLACSDPEASYVSSESASTFRSPSDIFPSTWRQVLTRGFPTYRAQAHLIVDPTSGKTYLFSGYINSEYVPTRVQNFARSFADIWELRIDIPGGNFDEVDLEEEARTAKAGPWQRCFGCGSAGPWKKCGGACGGRAFFCNPQCLRDGWKEHKQNHNCKKV